MTVYPLHTAALRILIADHRCRLVEATLAGAASEDIIFLAIVEKLLHTAAECPAERLDHLVELWLTSDDTHQIEYDAKVCAAEYVEGILDDAEPRALPAVEAETS